MTADHDLTAERLTARMHAVLDGAATSHETRELHALLASSPAAADEFASWKAIFDGMANMPMAHPPEGLAASIVAALPRRAADESAGRDQLYPAPSVLGSGEARSTRRPFGFHTISSWLVPASSKEYQQMNTQRKFLAVGAAGIVALGIAAVLTSFPPKSNDVLGTVVPAERYRAPQTGAEGVKLGEQAGSSSTTIAGSADAPAAASVANQNAAAQSAADQSANFNAQSVANMNAAQSLANQSVANQNVAQSLANQNVAQSLASQNAAQSAANQSAAQSAANQSAAQSLANQSAAQSLANQSSAQSLANQNAQNQANQSAARSLANQSAAQSSAQSAAQNVANHNQAQNAAAQNAAAQNAAAQHAAAQNSAAQNAAAQNAANQRN